MPFFQKKHFLFLLVLLLGAIGFMSWMLGRQFNQKRIARSNSPLSVAATSSLATQATSISEFKTYHNKQFGFEFQYPNGWNVIENSFGSPFSKFNLILERNPKDYNPFNPSFLINVVTHDFANRAIISRKGLGASTSTVQVAGVPGIEYEYVFENLPQIDIDLPFGEYRMLLGAKREYEDVFNQILVSFKFLK